MSPYPSPLLKEREFQSSLRMNSSSPEATLYTHLVALDFFQPTRSIKRIISGINTLLPVGTSPQEGKILFVNDSPILRGDVRRTEGCLGL